MHRHYLITKLGADIGIRSRQLVTRPLGKRFFPHLLSTLTESSGDCLILSFTGIRLMDASFADEVFVTFATMRGQKVMDAACLVLRDLEATSLDNLVLALTSRPQREPGLRNCVLPVLAPEGQLVLVGKAEDHVKQTFEAVAHAGHLTARELADQEGLEIGAASTRLKVLSNLGLTYREETRDERGRLYIYQSLRNCLEE